MALSWNSYNLFRLIPWHSQGTLINCLGWYCGTLRELLLFVMADTVALSGYSNELFRLVLWHSQGTPMTDKCRQLWDQLGMKII